jgi:hypothetical protein
MLKAAGHHQCYTKRNGLGSVSNGRNKTITRIGLVIFSSERCLQAVLHPLGLRSGP